MTNLNKQNHFQKFNFQESFDLDLDILEEKYLSFQQLFHPDKLIGKSKVEQVNLEHNSVLINEAYEVLKSPLKRAIYLLDKQGININHDSCHIKPDHETLIENLELRETIFETPDKEKLSEIRKSCSSQIKLILKQAKEDFNNNSFEKCALELIKAKYLDKSLIEIKLKISKL
jgi:molecular chaperone HscB